MDMQTRPEFSVNEAVAMYERLRRKGQTGPLARLSVEARCAALTPQQRQQVRQLLSNYETLSK